MLQIDGFAYSNRWVSVHPAEKTVFALFTMMVCLFFYSPLVSLGAMLLMVGVTVLGAGISVRLYLKLVAFPVFFILMGAVTVAFSFSWSAVGYVWFFQIGNVVVGVTQKGLDTAVLIFLKSLGATSSLFFLSLTTPVAEIVAILKKARVPVLFLELFVLVYRFIFILLETAHRIFTAQSSRLGYRTMRTGYQSMGQLAANLVVVSHRRSQELYVALSSRGYYGDLNVLEREYILSTRNIFLIVITEALLIILSFVKW